MNPPAAFVRSNGNGDNIICLHSSLGSSRQWSELSDRLQSSFKVNATDLYGYGHSPDWALDRSFRLEDEVNLLTPLVESLEGPLHLIGHSYGGAVALKLAEKFSDRIHSLVVYEPVLFSVLFGSAESQEAAKNIMRFKAELQYEVNNRQYESATRKFIDYWSGAGSWNQFPWQKQATMIEKISVVLNNFDAIIFERNTLDRLAKMKFPVLYLCGDQSPESSLLISRIATRALPNVNYIPMPEMGHMGPVTHSEVVNDTIEGFIQGQSNYFDGPEFPFAA